MVTLLVASLHAQFEDRRESNIGGTLSTKEKVLNKIVFRLITSCIKLKYELFIVIYNTNNNKSNNNNVVMISITILIITNNNAEKQSKKVKTFIFTKVGKVYIYFHMILERVIQLYILIFQDVCTVQSSQFRHIY